MAYGHQLGQSSDGTRFALVSLAFPLNSHCLSPDERVAALAERELELLRRRRMVNYPAILSLRLRLFAEQREVLRLLQYSSSHVLADETRDVCAAQHPPLRCLAERYLISVVVGDPLQQRAERVGHRRDPLARGDTVEDDDQSYAVLPNSGSGTRKLAASSRMRR